MEVPRYLSHAISILLAAFNYAEENHEIANPLKGLKKPVSQPRLHSFSKEDEQAIYVLPLPCVLRRSGMPVPRGAVFISFLVSWATSVRMGILRVFFVLEE